MPSPVTRTFDGLMSRCRTPRSCACSSASAIRRPTRRSPARSVRRASAAPPRRSARRRCLLLSGPSRSSTATRSAPDRAALHLGVGQDPRQRDPAEIGHAEQVQPRRRVGPVGVDRDDVRVLEPGQRLRLARAGPRDLQRHRPVGELPLRGAGRRGRTRPGPAPRPGGSPRSSGPPRGTRRPASPASLQDRSVWPEPTSPWMSKTRRESRRDLGEPGEVLGRVGRPPRPPRGGRTPRRSGRPGSRRRGRGSGRDTTRRRPPRRPPSAGPGRRGAGRAGRRGSRAVVGQEVVRVGARPGSSRQAASNRRARRTAAAGRRFLPGPARGRTGSSRLVLPARASVPPPEVLQHPLDGPLADPEPLADVLAREPLGLQLQDRRAAPRAAGRGAGRRPRGPAPPRSGCRSPRPRPWAGRSSTQSGSSRCMSCFRLAARRYSSITLFFAARARNATRCRESSNSAGPLRTRRKKLPQTLWRKSSESNRDRNSRGNCRRTTSRTSASYRASSSRAAASSPAWILARNPGESLLLSSHGIGSPTDISGSPFPRISNIRSAVFAIHDHTRIANEDIESRPHSSPPRVGEGGGRTTLELHLGSDLNPPRGFGKRFRKSRKIFLDKYTLRGYSWPSSNQVSSAIEGVAAMDTTRTRQRRWLGPVGRRLSRRTASGPAR